MVKHYRVIKENLLWEVDAILESYSVKGVYFDTAYRPIEDIWNRQEDQTESLADHIVENNPDFFERVYKSDNERMIFKTKEQLKQVYKKFKP